MPPRAGLTAIVSEQALVCTIVPAPVKNTAPTAQANASAAPWNRRTVIPQQSLEASVYRRKVTGGERTIR
jgi:hypothetical protein